MPEDKKSPWGGKRRNSGRRKKIENPVARSIKLDLKTIELIQELGYNVSEFYRDAGDRYLAYLLRKSKKKS